MDQSEPNCPRESVIWMLRGSDDAKSLQHEPIIANRPNSTTEVRVSLA